MQVTTHGCQGPVLFFCLITGPFSLLHGIKRRPSCIFWCHLTIGRGITPPPKSPFVTSLGLWDVRKANQLCLGLVRSSPQFLTAIGTAYGMF
jgi:hypothetical protein